MVNKTAWVRTYLRSGRTGFDNGQLAGHQRGAPGRAAGRRRVGDHRDPALAERPVAAEDTFANYDAERGNIDSTLNFVVPASLITGLLRFTVDVASARSRRALATVANGSARLTSTCSRH